MADRLEASRLEAALSAASLSEYTASLLDRIDQLNAIRRGAIDKKELLEVLKQAGCSKMGVRQRLAILLTSELMAGPTSTASPISTCNAATDGIWDQLAGTTMLELDDLPQPASAEADLALLSEPKLPPASAAVAPPPPAVRISLASASAVPPAAEVTSSSSSSTEREAAAEDVTASPPMPTPVPSRGIETASACNAAEQQAELFHELGDEALGRKDVTGAERWYAQALCLCPNSPELLSRLATCATVQTSPAPARALEHLRALLALPPHPLQAEARLRAAECCQQLGALDDALELCAAALAPAQVSPSSARAQASPPPPPPAASAVTAAAAVAAAAVGVRAHELQVKLSYALEQVARARRCVQERRTVEALQAAHFVRQACPASLLGSELALAALEAEGRLEEAVDEARDAAAKHGATLPVAIITLARLLARRGRPDEAEAQLLGLEVLGKAGALCTRSEVARAGLERAAIALHTLRQARSLKAEGNAAYGAGQYERAISIYSEALRVDIEGALEPALLGNRSQAYAKVRSFSLALADCDRAIAIDAGATKLQLRRASFKAELGDLSGAVNDYEAILERDPGVAAAVAGLEHAKEVESGADGRKGCLIEFENERLDPYAVLDVPKDANAVQIKAAFRKLALQLHPDKLDGSDEAEKEQAASRFRRVRIAYSVLSDPQERNRLDAEGLIRKTGGKLTDEIKPFHEYYSINTPAGYTRGGDFVSTRRYDPMVGALDSLGRIHAAEKISRKQIAALKAEEVIRLKGPEEHLKLGYHDSANAPDQYNKYWDKVSEQRALVGGSMRELSAPNTKFFGKDIVQPKLIAQTRYMPLEVEQRDDVQRSLMMAPDSSVKIGHREI